MSASVRRIVVVNIPFLVSERDSIIPDNARSDGYSDSSEEMINTLNLSLNEIPFNKKLVASTAFSLTNKWNDKQWKKVQKSAMGVDIFQAEPWLRDARKTFINENVTLITSMQDDYLKSVSQSLNRGLSNGDSIVSIAKDIRSRTKVSKNRAKLIGRDQVSKLNGQLTRLRQTDIGIEQYIWDDSGDSRVRATHKSNNGKVFNWNSPPSNTGHPSHEVNCRCVATPIFDPVIERIIS